MEFKLEKFLEILRAYQKDGLTIKEAMKKVYEKHGIIFSEITKRIDEDDAFTLDVLIQVLSEIDPDRTYKDAIDKFASDFDEQIKRTHKV